MNATLNKIQVLVFALFFINSWGQNFSIDPRSISNTGNMELLRQIDLYKDIDGNPYLTEQYQQGYIKVPNGNDIVISARLHMGASYFEIVGADRELFKYTPSAGTSVILGDKEYLTLNIYPQNAKGGTMLVEKSIPEAPYGLYINRRKSIEQPRKEGIAMPSSSFSDPKNPKWVESSEYYLFREGKTYQLSSNPKELWESELLLPKHRAQKKKPRLRKESEIIEWVNTLNKS